MITNKDDESDKLKKDLENAKKQIDDLTNNWKRALADYQNLEKREVLQRVEIIKIGIAEVIRDLLVVLDSLYKADLYLKDQGLKLAIREFEKVLESHGIVRISTSQNKKFDPIEMECVEVVENGKEDEVLEEVRLGYKMGNMIIRTAQVKVGKKQTDKKTEGFLKEEVNNNSNI